jgi:hypothetical protein
MSTDLGVMRGFGAEVRGVKVVAMASSRVRGANVFFARLLLDRGDGEGQV